MCAASISRLSLAYSRYKLLQIILLLNLIIHIACFVSAEDLVSISDTELWEKISAGENVAILWGRESCGMCVAATENVQKASEYLQLPVYYMDGDLYGDSEFAKNNDLYLSPALLLIRDDSLWKYEGKITYDTATRLIGSMLPSKEDRFDDLRNISYPELQDKMNQDLDFILYIGRSDCPDCQDFSPIVQEYVSKHSESGMYYLDVKEYRDAQSSDLGEANVYQQIKETFSLNWVPCLFHIRNGIIIAGLKSSQLMPRYPGV